MLRRVSWMRTRSSAGRPSGKRPPPGGLQHSQDPGGQVLRGRAPAPASSRASVFRSRWRSLESTSASTSRSSARTSTTRPDAGSASSRDAHLQHVVVPVPVRVVALAVQCRVLRRRTARASAAGARPKSGSGASGESSCASEVLHVQVLGLVHAAPHADGRRRPGKCGCEAPPDLDRQFSVVGITRSNGGTSRFRNR